MSAYDYRKFHYDSESYLILGTIERYHRTESGKSWKSKPHETKHKVFPAKHYENYITAIPWFNNFGDYSRAKWNYTIAGYLPTSVVSVSPGATEKSKAHFQFIHKKPMETAAGFRELEILKNAKRFRLEYVDGAKMLYLYTDYEGDTAAGIYDITRKIWRG